MGVGVGNLGGGIGAPRPAQNLAARGNRPLQTPGLQAPQMPGGMQTQQQMPQPSPYPQHQLTPGLMTPGYQGMPQGGLPPGLGANPQASMGAPRMDNTMQPQYLAQLLRR